MTILVTGSTGTIGSEVVARLAAQGVQVRALARDTSKLKLATGVDPVAGDMTDVASMRAALRGIDTLFLLNAVVADETTQALVTLDLAREAGIQRIVYFSVLNSALFEDVPHFAGKYLVERVIDAQAIPATVLRPAYFMQNDLMFRDALEAGAYPQPIGGVGITMIDIGDIADAAVAEVLRRERAPHPLPRTTIELVGPDTLTGKEIAAIWASVLGREIRYGGDDLEAFENQAARVMPGWKAHDLRLMLRAFQRFGLVPGKDSQAILEGLIGHPLRSYRAFAEEAAASWNHT
ncbi:MAG: NmrA/HSCARG family protein [Acetobacteraceae bacterium]|nr:NmrA/HSCARG family protein [Acetobacteraceae bacterium]